MRKIESKKIEKAVRDLAIEANISLRRDILAALKKSFSSEKKPRAKRILKLLIENANIAKNEKLAICQDTGMAMVFCEIGQDVRIEGDIENAINKGIKQGYREGFLRKSVVSDPINILSAPIASAYETA